LLLPPELQLALLPEHACLLLLLLTCNTAGRQGLPYEVYTGAADKGEIERISAHDITPQDFAERFIKRS
jgi:hypothetical protein